MKSKISKISILFFACLTLFFLVGCGQTEVEDDDNDLVNGEWDDDLRELDNGLVDEEEPEEIESIPPGLDLEDDKYWDYIRFSVDSTCMMFDGDMPYMTDDDWDGRAQEYGFSSMEEIDNFQIYNLDKYNEDYASLLEETCPEIIEILVALGEGFE